ncbi:MAG: class IV adenylate cyclase [Candidatus Hodarchaeales archaeon]|jgi:predicted adenylyl cyclase CyaB
MVHINIEFKARCDNPEKIRKILLLENPVFRGKDDQIDTYFNVKTGRLKLREGNIENALIYYERPDVANTKQSTVLLYHPESDNTSSLKEILIKTLGVLTVVDKEREIYFIDNVKFHIDYVKNLGHFMEVEAIDADGSIGTQKLQEQCDHYRKLFQISEDDLVEVSYSDLISQP